MGQDVWWVDPANLSLVTARLGSPPFEGAIRVRAVGKYAGPLGFVVMQATHFGTEAVAAFRDEGAAAAFIESLTPVQRRSHWLEKDGRVVENVRYREKRPGGYGHAMAILDRVDASERERLATSGFQFADTGRVES